jgi:hypothetical protein
MLTIPSAAALEADPYLAVTMDTLVDLQDQRIHKLEKSFEFDQQSLENEFQKEVCELQEQQQVQLEEIEVAMKIRRDEDYALALKSTQDHEQQREEMRNTSSEKINGLRKATTLR